MAVTGFGEIAEKLRRSTVLVPAGAAAAARRDLVEATVPVISERARRAGHKRSVFNYGTGREFQAMVASRDPHRDHCRPSH